MAKEICISSTPHETRLAIVEDDQLTEIYYERENEYTLAGSIYKGRVTRVLPGMQSAFVDIGLERDAFLYVSDFMELESQDEEIEEVPATAMPDLKVAERTTPSESSAAAQPGLEGAPSVPPEGPPRPSTGGPASEQREERGWRGRRRRRGRRERGNGQEARYSRPSEPQAHDQRGPFGPPPGYQPIILPGESISKYRSLAQRPADVGSTSRTEESSLASGEAEAAIWNTFPGDEPLFASPGHESEQTEGVPPASDQPETSREHATPSVPAGSDEWDRDHKRFHEMNVASVFGGTEAEDDSGEEPEEQIKTASPGVVEEEEIDEEEADLASYVEELEEDAAFDEMEEETQSAGEQ